MSCTTISGRKKMIVPKLDNLEKHKGKCTCQQDGVPLPHLTKDDKFIKSDCNYVKLCKLWIARKQGCTVANQQ